MDASRRAVMADAMVLDVERRELWLMWAVGGGGGRFSLYLGVERASGGRRRKRSSSYRVIECDVD